MLHKMRVALERLAFELARRSHAAALTDAQERASTFPICESPAAFDAFFPGRKASLYDDQARAAFRAVQPFINIEQAHQLGLGLERMLPSVHDRHAIGSFCT